MSELIFKTIETVAGVTMTSEGSIDAALCDTARLLITTAEAYKALNLPASAVQPALDHLERALTTQLEGRRHVGKYHMTVGKLAKVMGADPDDFGPIWPCPKMPTGEKIEKPSTVVPLHVAASA